MGVDGHGVSLLCLAVLLVCYQCALDGINLSQLNLTKNHKCSNRQIHFISIKRKFTSKSFRIIYKCKKQALLNTVHNRYLLSEIKNFKQKKKKKKKKSSALINDSK